MTQEWREAKPKKSNSKKIWEFQRGYRVNEAGKHEDDQLTMRFSTT